MFLSAYVTGVLMNRIDGKRNQFNSIKIFPPFSEQIALKKNWTKYLEQRNAASSNPVWSWHFLLSFASPKQKKKTTFKNRVTPSHLMRTWSCHLFCNRFTTHDELRQSQYMLIQRWQQLPGCVFPWSALVLQVQICPGIPTEVSANPHLCVAFWWTYPSPQNKGPKRKWWWWTFYELLKESSVSRDGNKCHSFIHRSAQFYNWQRMTWGGVFFICNK